mgnify:CR=1 FL=1
MARSWCEAFENKSNALGDLAFRGIEKKLMFPSYTSRRVDVTLYIEAQQSPHRQQRGTDVSP